MRYYKQFNENKRLIVIGTGAGGTEITETEYNSVLAEIYEKAELVNKLYNGEISINDVPTNWRDEIQRRVNERVERDKNTPESVKNYGVDEDVYNSIIDDYTLSLIEGGVL